MDSILWKEAAKDAGNWCANEFGDVEFGDERLNRRLLEISADLLRNPLCSINQASGKWSKSKAAYRFFSNSKVTRQEMLAAHQDQSLQRIAESGSRRVLVVQDTCFLNFNNHFGLTGLGPIGTTRPGMRPSQGMILHTAFGIDPRGGGLPIGILDQKIWSRKARVESKSQLRGVPIAEKESFKWVELIRSTRELVPSEVELVHICDREADINAFIVSAHEQGAKFVVRSNFDRKVVSESSNLWKRMQSLPAQGAFTLQIPHQSRTKDRDKKDSRVVELEVRFEQLDLQSKKENPEAFSLSVVHVSERVSEKCKDPIEWMLLTNLPVPSLEGAMEIVRYYRQRWHIENYHYVLKSGFKVENCELETMERMEKYIGLISLLAWRLYWMSRASREIPSLPCTEFLAEHEWRILNQMVGNKHVPITKPPSNHEAIRWVAKLGGFLGRKGDGEPGITTIWRGWIRLRDLSAGYLLHQNIERCG